MDKICCDTDSRMLAAVKGTILIYSLAIAGAALLLQWLDFQHAVRTMSTPVYVVIVALLFTALGIWVGQRLTRGTAPRTFERNLRAIDTLGITEREVEVLELLAQGQSNQEIGDSLFVSLNTVKTHLAHLYEKLEVSRRTQAIHKARALDIIP
ncbi:MAG: response regulator transcription factor [Thermoanaerobaculia bacterium]